MKQEKRWLKVMKIRQKAKKIRAYFDAPPNYTDALCATYVVARSGKPTFAFRRLLAVRNFKLIEYI